LDIFRDFVTKSKRIRDHVVVANATPLIDAAIGEFGRSYANFIAGKFEEFAAIGLAEFFNHDYSEDDSMYSFLDVRRHIREAHFVKLDETSQAAEGALPFCRALLGDLDRLWPVVRSSLHSASPNLIQWP